jgi:hypothetical protein
MSWKDEQKWEKDWHGNCVNSYWEETKQIVYARKMGLQAQSIKGKYPVYDLQNKCVLDIGGGPYSMLLKCININKHSGIVDPCDYPQWVIERYKMILPSSHILKLKGEDISRPIEGKEFDEVWIYNVLQHTDDPKKILQNAYKISRVIRVFEWIDTPITPGHPHSLTSKKLNTWLQGEGKTEDLNESGCVGRAYYGVFKGYFYE